MIHIVDDNRIVRDVMAELIVLFGFKVIEFSSPEAYLDYASGNDYQEPTAVFCDVMMPGFDGFELMNRIHAFYPRCRFVIMSGGNSTSCQHKQGACIYLIKPVRFDMLERVFSHLRACRQCGPSYALSTTWADDRSLFGVSDDSCPFLPAERTR